MSTSSALLMESFHPNAQGHGQIANCLGEFLRHRRSRGGLRPGEYGDLRLTTDLPGGPGDMAAAVYTR